MFVEVDNRDVRKFRLHGSNDRRAVLREAFNVPVPRASIRGWRLMIILLLPCANVRGEFLADRQLIRIVRTSSRCHTPSAQQSAVMRTHRPSLKLPSSLMGYGLVLKSIIASVAFPAFVLGHDPRRKIVCASYSSELALKHAGDCPAVITPTGTALFFHTPGSGPRTPRRSSPPRSVAAG